MTKNKSLVRGVFLLILSVTLLVLWVILVRSRAPEYGKLIPKDAYLVMNVDVPAAAKAFDLGDVTVLKDYIDQSLKHGKYSPSARERLEDVVDNFSETGLDLNSPLMLFAAKSFPNKYGVLGAVGDQDDLEEFLNILSKESVCTHVLEVDGLRYSVFSNKVLVFTNDWFLLTDKAEGQKSEREVLAEVGKLAEQTEENSIMANEEFLNLAQRDGFLHLLFMGEGVSNIADDFHLPYQNYKSVLPADVSDTDFAIACDWTMENGETRAVAELLPLTTAAADFIDDVEVCDDLEGDLNDYVPEDAVFYMVSNVQGKLLQHLFDTVMPVSALGADAQKLIGLAGHVDGDCALVVENKTTFTGIPEYSFYATTESLSWLDSTKCMIPWETTQIDDRTYSFRVPAMGRTYYGQSGFGNEKLGLGNVVVGKKNDVGYLLFGDDARVLEQVERPAEINDDCNMYARLNVEELLQMDILKKELGPIMHLGFRKIAGLFDYVEVKMEDKRKITLRVVMKDKEQSPMRGIYQETEKLLEFLL